MKPYQKIHSVYKRTPKGMFIRGDYAAPEVEYLQDLEWVWTEKVDGTNIRIGLEEVPVYKDEPVTMDDNDPPRLTAGPVPVGVELKYRVKGRTDNAQIPPRLLAAIEALDLERKLREHFDGPVCLYGEGYGAKIQKGGGNYRPDQGFILFDVTVGQWQLRRKDVVAVAEKLGIDVVPEVFQGTVDEALELVDREEGVQSAWGCFRAEGLVGIPRVPLYDRKGNRIAVKLKSKDFDRLRRAGL